MNSKDRKTWITESQISSVSILEARVCEEVKHKTQGSAGAVTYFAHNSTFLRISINKENSTNQNVVHILNTVTDKMS